MSDEQRAYLFFEQLKLLQRKLIRTNKRALGRTPRDQKDERNEKMSYCDSHAGISFTTAPW
ncbi:MAG: hypothetical protein ISQ06_03755 [Planctomycetaceae bacterium]|nr:hypothetical protein [Planctomycetaceae bacterium]